MLMLTSVELKKIKISMAIHMTRLKILYVPDP